MINVTDEYINELASNTFVFGSQIDRSHVIQTVIDKINKNEKNILVLSGAFSGRTLMGVILSRIVINVNPNSKILYLSGAHNDNIDKNKRFKQSTLNLFTKIGLKSSSFEMNKTIGLFTILGIKSNNSNISTDSEVYVAFLDELVTLRNKKKILRSGINFDYVIFDSFEDSEDDLVNLIKEDQQDASFIIFPDTEIVNVDEYKELPVTVVSGANYLKYENMRLLSEQELIKQKESLELSISEKTKQKCESDKKLKEYELVISRLQNNNEEMQNKYEEEKNKNRELEKELINKNELVDIYKHIDFSKQINVLQETMLKKFDNLQETVDYTKEKVDAMYYMLKNLVNSINKLQEDTSLELKNISDEIKKEECYAKFSCEYMKKIEQYLELKKDENYYTQEQRLIAKFNEINWNKLKPESRKYLITSKILYHNLKKYKNQIDYSPACIPLTKALEGELFQHIFKNQIKYLQNRGISMDKWPDGLTYYNNRCGKFYVNYDEKYSLGSIPFIIGWKMSSYDGRSQNSNNAKKLNFIDFCKNELFKPDAFTNDSDLIDYINNLCQAVEQITNKYRNQAAHKDEILIKNAEKCYDYIIKTTKVLIEFIDKIK